MNRSYDLYDYPAYWNGRDYEHRSETIALGSLLQLARKEFHSRKSFKTIIDIGCGFGRLTPIYSKFAKQLLLIDPSLKSLQKAKLKNEHKSTAFINTDIEHLTAHVPPSSCTLALCIRVAHHIKDFNSFLSTVHSILEDNGFFILEFANKRHGKAILRNAFHGDFTFPFDVSPLNLTTHSSSSNSLPFINYHPEVVLKSLQDRGFKVVKTLSVSNFRSSHIKKLVSVETLIEMEKYMQELLAYKMIGPSIFVLSQKMG